MATGQIGSENDVVEVITWANEDFENIQAGGLIGLYWFPDTTGSTAVLPENNFQIGGLQETNPDADSGGDAGMIVPSNNGQTLKIAFYDNIFNSTSRLPPSRFTAINVPPSGYQIWRDAEFTPTQIALGDADPDADPDKDGWVNELEYATSSPPLDANPSPLTLTRVNDTVELQFERVADEELSYRIESTQDLSSSPWPDIIFESSGVENLAGSVDVSETLGPGERFFRLSVDAIGD
jgi:hypothetical protein